MYGISMKRKVLFLVHVENMFRKYFPDNMYVNRLIRAFNVYDRVICLNSEVDDFHPIPEINQLCPEEITWGWGYEKGMFYDPNDENWIIESSGHECTWIPQELRNKQKWMNYDIAVGGGSRWECLQDWLCILDFMEIAYKVVDGYCYGW